MEFSNRKTSGALLFVGASQFLVGMVMAEALYPGYSVRDKTISSLGVGPSAIIFNASVILLGAMVLLGAYFLRKAIGKLVLPSLIAITGLGAIGVGLVPTTYPLPHLLLSLITFLFGGLAAIAAYKVQASPLNYFSVIVGVNAITVIILFFNDIYLGLGVGGLERMMAYPLLLWAVGFGGHLIASSQA
jgi:hypothetical membrane protein